MSLQLYRLGPRLPTPRPRDSVDVVWQLPGRGSPCQPWPISWWWQPRQRVFTSRPWTTCLGALWLTFLKPLQIQIWYTTWSIILGGNHTYGSIRSVEIAQKKQSVLNLDDPGHPNVTTWSQIILNPKIKLNIGRELNLFLLWIKYHQKQNPKNPTNQHNDY